jgi:uncharacterized membrane protein YfcA
MEENLILLILVGFGAQVIDGSLGMAYGVSSSTFLLSLGVPPVVASASVHIAEVFTTLVSGVSHWKLGNVDKELIKKLAVPGVLGGVLGAYIISSVDNQILKPIVSFYLLLMGVRIVIKALRKKKGVERAGDSFSSATLAGLGLLGGFCDAAGGGGWGPIVTTTLISNGAIPRKTIGSVNLTEFFVTFAESLTFIALLGTVQWRVVAGLIIGGIIAAPFGAYLTKRIPVFPLMMIVGILIIILSLRTILGIF